MENQAYSVFILARPTSVWSRPTFIKCHEHYPPNFQTAYFTMYQKKHVIVPTLVFQWVPTLFEMPNSFCRSFICCWLFVHIFTISYEIFQCMAYAWAIMEVNRVHIRHSPLARWIFNQYSAGEICSADVTARILVFPIHLGYGLLVMVNHELALKP